MPNVLVVPKDQDGTKYKAVRWFALSHARPDTWYIFLDDDSYPLDTKFLPDIAYYGARGYAAGNGVLVPRPGRSALAYALDWIRHFDDLTRFRLALEVLRRPIFGMHGELLIIRGDVLREIWPAVGDTVTEDFGWPWSWSGGGAALSRAGHMSPSRAQIASATSSGNAPGGPTTWETP